MHNNFVKSADMYFLEFASLVETEKSKMDMFKDMDDLDDKFREWAKLSKDWKPKKVDNGNSRVPGDMHGTVSQQQGA